MLPRCQDYVLSFNLHYNIIIILILQMKKNEGLEICKMRVHLVSIRTAKIEPWLSESRIDTLSHFAN